MATQSEELHAFYNLLPSYLSHDKLQQERKTYMEELQDTLTALQDLHSDHGKSNTLRKRHFRVVKTVVGLKHEIPKAMHKSLIDQLVIILWQRQGRDVDDVDLQIKGLKTLGLLLKHWASTIGKEGSGIEIDWRVAYEAVEAACFADDDFIAPAAQTWMQQLASATIQSVETARPFFHHSENNLVHELWSEFGPRILETDRIDCFRSLAYLSLFLTLSPRQNVYQYVSELVPTWLEVWSRISRSPEWDGHWMKVIAQVVKTYPDLLQTRPVLQFIFGKVQDGLDLPSDLGAPFRKQEFPTELSMLKGSKKLDIYHIQVCVHLLQNQNSKTEETLPASNQYVLNLVDLVQAFLHPSNVSNSAEPVAVFLLDFTRELAKRFGREKAKVQLDEIAFQDTLQVTSVRPILDALMSAALFGIYSKSVKVSSECIRILQNALVLDGPYCTTRIMEEMLRALDPSASSQSHRATTAIRCLAQVLGHVLYGRQAESNGKVFQMYLSPLLQLTLAGIDTNDDSKTHVTVMLYFRLLNWLPLSDDTSKKDVQSSKQRSSASEVYFNAMKGQVFATVEDANDEVDQRAWELGPMLEEWSLALLDRCLTFCQARASGQDNPQASSMQAGNGKEPMRLDAGALEVTTLMGLLYGQMSPALFDKAVSKTREFIETSFFSSQLGGSVCSEVVSSCVSASDGMTGSAFLSVAMNKLQGREQLMQSEKKWGLYLLHGVIKSRGVSTVHLLEEQTAIRDVLRHFMTNTEEKDVQELAADALQSLLKTLSSVYVQDFKSLPPSAWEHGTKEENGLFQYMGAAMSWEKVEPQWHEPNAQELEVVYELLSEHALEPLKEIKGLQQSQDADVKSWTVLLKRLNACVQGVSDVLVDGSEFETTNALVHDTHSLLQKALSNHTDLYKKLGDVKPTMMHGVHDAIVFWQSNTKEISTVTQIWHLMLPMLSRLVRWSGDSVGTFRQESKQVHMMKSATMDVASQAYRRKLRSKRKQQEVPLMPRNDMLERLKVFLGARLVQQQYEMAHQVLSQPRDSSVRQLYENLLGDLEPLLQNAYESVRTKATMVLSDVSGLFNRWMLSRVPAMLDIMEGNTQKEVKEETIVGVLQILKLPRVIANLWMNRGENLSRAVIAVLKSNDALVNKVQGEADKVKVGMLVQSYLLAVLSPWRYVAQDKSSFVDSLLKAEPSVNEHWKFHLLHLAAFFPALQVRDAPLPDALWELVVRKMESELPPVRQAATELFSRIVLLEKVAAKRDLSFVVKKDVIQTLVTAAVENRKSSNRFAASADGQHAGSAPSDWSFGVNEVLKYLGSGSVHAFPKTRPLSNARILSPTRNTFSTAKYSSLKLVEYLVEIGQEKIFSDGNIIQILQTLSQKVGSDEANEDRQAVLSTLAEWIGGLLRSTKDLERFTKVLSILQTVLPTLSLPLMDTWMQMTLFVTLPKDGQDMLRLQPLLSYYLDELEKSFGHATEADYAPQVKWMRLAGNSLINLLPAAQTGNEQEVRMVQEASKRLLDVITQHALAHQYQIIRERAALLLALLGGYSFQATRTPMIPDASSQLPIQKLVDMSRVNAEDEDMEKEEDTMLRARETAIMWLLFANHSADVSLVMHVMPSLFPIALVTQSHHKAETAVLAKRAMEGLAGSLRLFSASEDMSNVDLMLSSLDSLRQNSFWKTRGTVLRFLSPFAFYHWLFLPTEYQRKVQDVAVSLLSDEQREVQEMAKYTLRSLVHNTNVDSVSDMSSEWRQEARDVRDKYGKLERRRVRMEKEGDKEEVAATEARMKKMEPKMARSVLSLCAVVLAYPHTLPDYVPLVIEEMGRYLYLRVKSHSTALSFLVKTVKDALREFKRTHQDDWQGTREKLTTEQIEFIEDAVEAPTYYT